jgi:two-component system CheB/CheR fusion protein
MDGELKMIVTGALKRALADPSTIVFKGVRAGGEGDETPYRVSLRSLQPRNTNPTHVLISFEAMTGEARPAARPETEIELDQVSRQQLAALESELGHTKEHLQSAIEQLEASNEELQASNEELQSSNEELQSTNEELQSVNEELYTVNSEYQRKITELTELTNDMDNLLASTDVGTIFLDGQLRIRKFTPQIAETFDLVSHDVGRPIESFAHKMSHPELVEDLRRVLASGQPVERDVTDQEGRAFFLRILPYRAKGSADGVVLTLIDVTGLKTAEDALFHERYLLNSLLRTVPDAIYFKDARGRFIRANHVMASRLGLTDPAEAVGKTAFDVPTRELALALDREDEAVLRSGQPQHYRLERRAGADGGEAWDLVSRLPLLDRDGTTVGLIVIFRDVTEKTRAEGKIQEAVRRRDQFLAMLSHELRNPLGAIVTATAMLKSTGDGIDERAVSVLERQSVQMTRLLDDLLEASRVTQNKIDLRKRRVDLREVATEAAAALRGQMQAQQLRFHLDLPGAPVPVDGDPARLQQIQVNLLSNAAKYTPRGGEVHLHVQREGDGAVIRVKDNGVGMPPHMLESIFDLFVQSSRTLDRSAGGLGLGLTLVRSLVDLHGGRVTAHSAGEGLGSEFVVRLPLAEAADADLEAVPTPRGRARVPAGARVVVVEDNADSREMLCALLGLSGFECYPAENGAAALRLVEEVGPDVVILDVGLPGMNGFEVARRIRRNPRHEGVRLVALTGYGQTADRAASDEAGFDDHLVKPVHADQLLTLLADRTHASPPSGDGAAHAG